MFMLGAVSVVLFNQAVSSLSLQGHTAGRTSKVAIAILGGGLTSEGRVNPQVELRVQRALALYHELKSKNTDVTLIPISAGTTHKPPPLDSAGFPITEAMAGAKRLIDLGVPPSDVMEEGFSLDTLGYAYFLRSTHVDPGRFTRVIVVTNDWHMGRARAYFDAVFSLPRGDCSSSNANLEMEYQAVGPGIEREQESLRNFLDVTRREFSSMSELHEFLYTKHLAYSSSRLLRGHDEIDPKVKQSY